ncbi:MAG: ABC transporter ATP-binding protein [Planctomycetota bacterium]
MIETHRLCRNFGSLKAVDRLDLVIEVGETYGFLGPNGAGKTTTIRMLNGLLKPSSGRILLAGRSYEDGARLLRRITGLVPDSPPLYDYLTGRQYIQFVASLYGVDPSEREMRAEGLLERFGLAGNAGELCKGLSHGMKKKIQIVSVLVARPRILFLDEPTTGLDPRSARTLKEILVESCREGATVMLSTHILDTAEKICDRIGIIDQGRLKAEGTMEEHRSQEGAGSLEDIFLRLTGKTGETGHVESPAV